MLVLLYYSFHLFVFGDANLVILHMLYYPLGKVVLFVHILYMKNVGLKEREGKTKWSHEFSLCARGGRR